MPKGRCDPSIEEVIDGIEDDVECKNLEALGVERLAELLIEISTGNANHKRRLRMELVGNASGVELAREVRKRLGSIARAKAGLTGKR